MATSDQSGSLSDTPVNRRILRAVVCAMLAEGGFGSATEDVVETMVEMLNSFLTELARSTKSLSEHSCRSEPLVTDVVLALIQMGMNMQSLVAFSRKSSKANLPNLVPSQATQELKRLQLGTQPTRPSYIPDFLPQFPDSYSYIRTLTHAAPASGYQNIRERAAIQKRESARALTRFIAKTGDTENLFPDDPYAFPLIANKVKPMPYLDALLPKNPEENEAHDEDDDKWPNPQQTSDEKDKATGAHRLDRSESCISNAGSQKPDATGAISTLDSLDADSLIDNPYLRSIKMPKLKGTSKKHKCS